MSEPLRKGGALPPDLVTREEAAALLNLQPKTLSNWKSKNTGPRAQIFRRRVYYSRKELVDFAKAELALGKQEGGRNAA